MDSVRRATNESGWHFFSLCLNLVLTIFEKKLMLLMTLAVLSDEMKVIARSI